MMKVAGLRNATLDDLASVLKDQHSRKWDVIAPAEKLVMEGGVLRVKDAQQDLTPEGVTSRDVFLHPTGVFDEGLSDKLGIPLSYVRRLRDENIELYDENANGWFRHENEARSFLVRGFAGGDDAGVARAFLSDSYKMIDHLDALSAVLDGVRKAGVDVQIKKCDLTDRRMYVKIAAPSVQMYAKEFLDGYRSPFTGESGDENPWIEAGFVIKNSETGDGAFSIVPSMTVLVCKNGLTVTKDAMRAVHLGGKLDEGVVRWSEETQDKTLELITSKAADAVTTFLDVEYMQRTLRQLSEDAGRQLNGPADKVVRQVVKKLAFGEAHADGILDHFIKGGANTAGGVMHAFTSYAQTVKDADTAWMIEEQGIRALEVAASI